MGVERVTAGRERGLFEFLAASRPQRGWREGVAATAASIAGHGAIVGAVIAATLLSSGVALTDPPSQTEKVDVVELTSARAVEATDPDAFAKPTAEAKHALPEHAPAPSELERGHRVLARLTPPTIVPEDIPLPAKVDGVRAVLVSEYDGIGQDSTLSAAVIYNDHHDRTADQLAEGPPEPLANAYTQAPELANGDELQKILSRKYPPGLKDAGIGGRVLIWYLVDEFGHARRWLLKQSSGHRALDKAALTVAGLARFRPAMNSDRRVSVWVVLPVTFQVLDES